MSDAFECHLSARPEYLSGDPVTLDFELRNLLHDPRYVLRWFTPLEGVAGEIFRVERGGETLPYRGILAKRGEPSEGDYVELLGGATVHASVDLAQSYDVSEPGSYQVEFISGLHDVAATREEVPRPLGQHRPEPLHCGTERFVVVAR